MAEIQVLSQKIQGAFEICAAPFRDERGMIGILAHASVFEKHGLEQNWVEEYHSNTKSKFTLRGLYIQKEPFAEGKLISAISGTLMWVYVDLRADSPSFGCHGTLVLSPDRNNSLYLPRGMANGCVSLSDNCSVYLKTDNPYAPDSGTGIRWDDAELGIDWRLDGNKPLVSEAHSNYGSFPAYCRKMGISRRVGAPC